MTAPFFNQIILQPNSVSFACERSQWAHCYARDEKERQLVIELEKLDGPQSKLKVHKVYVLP